MNLLFVSKHGWTVNCEQSDGTYRLISMPETHLVPALSACLQLDGVRSLESSNARLNSNVEAVRNTSRGSGTTAPGVER